jgi:molybdenum cofactor cytidylyltransferase
MKGGCLPVLRIVVLAAGFSTRLGKPKALARIRGRSLLARMLGVLAPYRTSSRIIVVMPPRAARYRTGFSARNVDFVANPRRATGLASSVLLGIARARPCAGVLLVPMDLGDLTGRDVGRLIARWRGARRRVVATAVHETAGAPLILPHWLFAHARGLAGDRGLRDLVRRLPRDCSWLLTLPSAAADIDTPQALARARRRMRPGGP